MFNYDIKFLRNAFFKDINKHKTYILDSNIVVKLRDLFYSPKKMKLNEINYLIGLLEFFKDKDVMPGIAIQELSWDFEKSEIDETKLNRLIFAINSLLSYEEYIFNRIKNQENYVGDIKAIKGKKRNFNSLYLNADANILLLPTFCMMLKFYDVMYRYNDNSTRYIEICKFLKDTLKLVGAYELNFITDLLFSQDKYKTKVITAMLKINTKQGYMRKIWNCSWDIFFIRAITAFAANTLSNKAIEYIYNPILVTRDKNLYKTGQFVNSKNNYRVIGKQIYPGIEGGHEYSQKNLALIEKMQLLLYTTAEDRIRLYKQTSEDERIKHWKSIIKILEIELSECLS